MRGKRNAGWYGLALLLGVGLVGACGGMETDDAQLSRGHAVPEFDRVNLPPDVLVDVDGPVYHSSLRPRMPGAKRPGDLTLQGPVRRPQLVTPEPAEPTQRDSLVRCGEDELVDLRFDPDHCGECNRACATPYCYNGVCTWQPFGR
jgi:hypothetical protein